MSNRPCPDKLQRAVETHPCLHADRPLSRAQLSSPRSPPRAAPSLRGRLFCLFASQTFRRSSFHLSSINIRKNLRPPQYGRPLITCSTTSLSSSRCVNNFHRFTICR